MIIRTSLFFIFCSTLIVSAQKDSLYSKQWKKVNASVSLTLDEKKDWFDNVLTLDEKLRYQEETALIYYDFLRGFLKEKRFKKSIECSLQIQEIGQHTGRDYSDFYIKNDKNLVYLYYRNKDFYRIFSAGENYIKKHPENSKRLGAIYRMMGNTYCDIGDFEKAISHYRKAIYTFKTLKEHRQEGRTLVNLLEVYVKLEDEKYKYDIEESLRIIDSINTFYKFKDEDIIGKSLNAGVFYDFINDYSKAKHNYKNALSLSQQIADSLSVFKALNNLGIVSRKEDSLELSKQILKKAQLYTLNDRECKASIFNNLADVFMEEKNYVKALEFYDKAISEMLIMPNKVNVQSISIESINTATNKIDLLAYLVDKADVLLLLNEETNNDRRFLEDALNIYELSDKIIDIIYFESREKVSKLFWRKQAAHFYLNATQAAFKLKDLNKAFYFIEKSKALLLLENVTESNAKTLANLPNVLIEREFNLKNKINQTEILLSNYKNEKVIERDLDSIKNQVFIEKQNYSNFVDSLEVIFPKYYDYKKKFTVFTSNMVQENLKNDEIVLQYKLTLNKGYLVYLSNKDVKVYELENIAKIHSNLEQYKRAISKPFVNQEDRRQFKVVAESLFLNLFPFTKESLDVLNAKKLTIIPDGVLHTIPFESLVVGKEKSLNTCYLLNYCEISYAYSFSSLMNLSKNTFKFKNNFFAISPSKFKDKSIPELKVSKAEIAQIETLLGTKLLTNNKATKKTFLSNYGQSKVIHISTHGGFFNNSPWLAFNDQKLMLNEMYFKNQQADLVVLSACKTSLGDYKKGEGIMSIARAFANSGSKSVISSLWDINQKSSNDIILEFYKNLKKGHSKSEALKHAKLNYLSTYRNTSEASPYYWSGITLTGDKSAIIADNKFKWLSILVIIIILYLIKKLSKF